MNFTRVLDNLAEKSSAMLGFFDKQNDVLTTFIAVITRLIAVDADEEFDPDGSFWDDHPGQQTLSLTVGSRVVVLQLEEQTHSISILPNASGPHASNVLVSGGLKKNGLNGQPYFSDNASSTPDSINEDQLSQYILDTVQMNTISSQAVSNSIEKLTSQSDFDAQIRSKLGVLSDKARAAYLTYSEALKTKSTDFVLSTVAETIKTASTVKPADSNTISFLPGGIVTEDGIGWAVSGLVTSLATITGLIVAAASPVLGVAISLVGTVGSYVASALSQVDLSITEPLYNNESMSGTFANPFCQTVFSDTRLNPNLIEFIDESGIISLSLPHCILYIWRKSNSTIAVEGLTRYTYDDLSLTESDPKDAREPAPSRGCGGFCEEIGGTQHAQMYGGFLAQDDTERQNRIDHFSVFNGTLSGNLGSRAGIDLKGAITMIAYASQNFEWGQMDPTTPYFVADSDNPASEALWELRNWTSDFTQITTACTKLRTAFGVNSVVTLVTTERAFTEGMTDMLIKCINNTWLRHKKLIMKPRYTRSDHACNPPRFTRTALILGSLLGVAAAAAIAATTFVITKKISKRVNTARALSAAKVESSWTKLVNNPTKENANQYYTQVKKQTKISKLLGGTGFSTSGYWNSVEEVEPTQDDADLLTSVKNEILKIITG